MRTLDELLDLLARAAGIWRRRFAIMGAWFCVGYAGHMAGAIGSVLLGADHQVLATLAFVVGVMASVLALIMMIASCADLLQVRRTPLPDPALLPEAVTTPTRSTAVVALTIGPFLGVYALWGLVEDQVSKIYFVNLVLYGLSPDQWSVNLAEVRFYVILALISWVLRQVVARIGARRLTPLAILLEGTWVFASFLAIAAAASRILGWLRGREVWAWGLDLWRGFVDLLPDLRLPFDWTLPRIVLSAGDWLWHDLLPGLGSAVLLPLVWLALTASVFGWRQRSGVELVADTAIGRHATRIRDTAVVRRAARWRTGAMVTDWLTADLRGKYLPVLDALRLIIRAGPRFLGAYLVLATVLITGQEYVETLVVMLIGPQTVTVALAVEPFLDLVSQLLFTTGAVAVYVAAVDRIFAHLAQLEPRAGRAAGGPISGGIRRSRARSTIAAGR